MKKYEIRSMFVLLSIVIINIVNRIFFCLFKHYQIRKQHQKERVKHKAYVILKLTKK